jgi:hypothetical protein
MLFLTILFIAFAIRYFVRGRAYHDTLIEIERKEIAKARAEVPFIRDKINKDIIALVGPVLFIVLCGGILQTYYLYQMYNYVDVHKYPTLFMIGYLIFQIILAQSAKVDTEARRSAREFQLDNLSPWSVKQTISTSIWLSYLLYSLFLLVG